MMLAMFLAVILAGTQAVAAPGPGVTTAEELQRLRGKLPPVTVGPELLNEGEIAAATDYPKEAMAKNQEGTAHARLLIGADGRVQRCGIAQSSGSDSLDTQTCDLFIANAKFRPARGKSGRAVASIYERQMVWLLAGDPPVIVRNQVRRESFIVGPNGEMRDCTPEFRVAAEKWIEGPKEQCAAFADKAGAVLLAARETSKLHDAHVVLEARAFFDASETMPPVANGPGDRLVYLRSVTMSFDPSGKRLSCTRGESVGTLDFRADPCADPTFDKLPPEMLQAGMAAETVRFVWAIYLKNEPKQVP